MPAAAGAAATSTAAPGRARCAAPSRRAGRRGRRRRGRRRWPRAARARRRARRPASSPTGWPTASASRRRYSYDVAGGVAAEGGGERRHVVGAHAGDRSGRDRRQALRVVQAELLLVQPDDVPAGERLAELVGHGAEVLADDRRRRPRRLGGDHGQQLLARVPHVRPFGRAHALRYPPQPVHAHHVVDPQHRRVLARRGRRAAATASGRRAGRRPGSCGGKPQSWPSAKNSSGGAPTVMPGGEQVAVGPRLVAGDVAADRQVEGERGAAVALDRGRAGGRRGTGRAGGCARRAPRARRRRRRRVLGAEAGEVDDVGTARRRSGRCRPGCTGRGRGRPRAAGGAGGRPARRQSMRSCCVGHRRGRQRGVVEVHLVPVQPAHRRVRAGVERVVEERGVQRQRGDDADAEARGAAAAKAARWANDGSGDGALPQRVRRGRTATPPPASAGSRGIAAGGTTTVTAPSAERDAVAADRAGRAAARRARRRRRRASAGPVVEHELGVGRRRRPRRAPGGRRRPARRAPDAPTASASSTSTIARSVVVRRLVVLARRRPSTTSRRRAARLARGARRSTSSGGASVGPLPGAGARRTTIERGARSIEPPAGISVPGSWHEVGVELDDPLAAPTCRSAPSTAARCHWR